MTTSPYTRNSTTSVDATLLNESRLFDPDVIEAQLAHRDTDAVRRIYNRADYWN